ncbi:MAG: TPM domain-containing protein [Pseudomonadales bacterium]
MRKLWLRLGASVGLLLTVGLLLLWLRPDTEVGTEQITLVRDDAGLMTPDERAALARHHQYLLRAFDIDYRVETSRGLDDVDRVAVTLLREFGQRSRSESGRALLLLVDAGADQVRLEVGYPLEGAFPDAFVDYVERHQMVPFFERGRIADGIAATTELIVSRARVAAGEMDAATEAWRASSGGAGATADARLGAGSAAGPVDSGGSVSPGSTPEATLAAYVQAMADHNADPELPIYTADTRAMLANWLVTPAQMDNLVRSHRQCRAEPALVDPTGARAVIRYPPGQRACAPYFFVRQENAWQLDLTMMQKALRFGASNAWHFDPAGAHPYGFAFADWDFDARGYPHPRE